MSAIRSLWREGGAIGARLLPVAAAGGAGLLVAGCAVQVGTAPQALATPTPARHQVGSVDGGAAQLQQQYEGIVGDMSSRIVEISTPQDLGSGVVFDAKGDIVTNDHVVNGASKVEVTLGNGRQYPGTVVGTFKEDDLAVVHVDATGLHPATFADATKLKVGDIVLAMGSPLGLQGSVTEGIVSAMNRTEPEETGNSIPDMIQTSAAINPGNSGGALVDLKGEVVGIVTLGAVDSENNTQAAGIGFGINSDMVRDIAGQLIRYGKVVDSHRAWLGVTVTDTVAQNGVLIDSVTTSGPAAAGGLKAGDTIIDVNAEQVQTSSDLSDILGSLQPGEQVTVTVLHQSGGQSTDRVTLGTYPGGS
ncbi:MAG TPA: trypsin-like peptidase domain-containing protein [Candidatus Dormibacteraeota bacterium]|nr:trypsin-like peptidase domain-containing protein [Candidatus Dormibacteraeota bacterium]